MPDGTPFDVEPEPVCPTCLEPDCPWFTAPGADR